MGDFKISELDALAATPDDADILAIVDDVVGTPITKKITVANLLAGAGVPVKATGAELTTATDDAKFATAKAIKDSHNVPSVLPSTDGKVMTSNGTDWISETPAGDSTKLPLTGGTMTGDIQLGETDIKLDKILSADGKWSGITEEGDSSEALVFGDLCFYDVSADQWTKVDANVSAGYNKKLGICVLAAAAGDDPTEMLLYGKIRADAAFPTLTVGAAVYVGETVGDVVVTQPTTSDVCIRIVGFANTANELFFNPSNDYIVHT